MTTGKVPFLAHPSGRADVMSLQAPLTEDTRHVVDAGFIELMKPGASVIDVARGELIDEDALVSALPNGRIAGAGLDVFANEPLPAAHPLLGLANVVLTHHVAGATDGTSRRRAQMPVSNVRTVLADGAPTTSCRRSGPERNDAR